MLFKIHRRRVLISLTVSAAMFLLALTMGSRSLESRPTDPVSEQLALTEAASIARGAHSYGIVQYTHFPNGPQYVIALLMKAGIQQPKSFRIVPLVFSALCVALLTFAIYFSGTNTLLSTIGVSGIGLMIFQPSFLEWMGCLYGNSYLLALCISGFALGLTLRAPNWLLTIIGVVLGWIGYDFTFCFIGATMTGRLLAISNKDKSMIRTLTTMLLAGLATGTGVCLAIASHLIQNALHFKSFLIAWNDLMGSAATRAGSQIGATLNPAYDQMIQSAMLQQRNASNGTYPRQDLLRDIWMSFSKSEWSNWSLILDSFLALGVVIACIVARAIWRGGHCRQIARQVFICCIGIITAILFSNLWYILMPQHARFHFHFIQRHLFIAVLVSWLTLWHLGNSILRWEKRETTKQ